MRNCPAHYALLIDNFNAKLEKRQSESENSLGKYRYRERNDGVFESCLYGKRNFKVVRIYGDKNNYEFVDETKIFFVLTEMVVTNKLVPGVVD